MPGLLPRSGRLLDETSDAIDEGMSFLLWHTHITHQFAQSMSWRVNHPPTGTPRPTSKPQRTRKNSETTKTRASASRPSTKNSMVLPSCRCFRSLFLDTSSQRREANRRLQSESAREFQEDDESAYERLASDWVARHPRRWLRSRCKSLTGFTTTSQLLENWNGHWHAFRTDQPVSNWALAANCRGYTPRWETGMDAGTIALLPKRASLACLSFFLDMNSPPIFLSFFLYSSSRWLVSYMTLENSCTSLARKDSGMSSESVFPFSDPFSFPLLSASAATPVHEKYTDSFSIFYYQSQDTFIVGCQFSEKIIYPETFQNNPDYYDPVYSTKFGIYTPHCGLDNVMLSWGHDEVSSSRNFRQPKKKPNSSLLSHWHLWSNLTDPLYSSICTTSSKTKVISQKRVLRWSGTTASTRGCFFPRPLPFHITLPDYFRSWHREGAYSHLTNEKDLKTLEAVRAFNPYDLYSKSNEPCDIEKLKAYYQTLIAKFFPPVLNW